MESLKQSNASAYGIIDVDKEHIQFLVFYDKSLNPAESVLYSDAFGRLLRRLMPP